MLAVHKVQLVLHAERGHPEVDIVASVVHIDEGGVADVAGEVPDVGELAGEGGDGAGFELFVEG